MWVFTCHNWTFRVVIFGVFGFCQRLSKIFLRKRDSWEEEEFFWKKALFCEEKNIYFEQVFL